MQVAVSTDNQSNTSNTTQLVTSGGQAIPIQLAGGTIQQLVANTGGEVPQVKLLFSVMFAAGAIFGCTDVHDKMADNLTNSCI